MEDNWNLKDKKQSTYNIFLDKVNRVYNKRDYHYESKDIDMLRRKLIEDINNNTKWALLTRLEMIKQINKRFGVEK